MAQIRELLISGEYAVLSNNDGANELFFDGSFKTLGEAVFFTNGHSDKMVVKVL